jgi:cytochrome b involved in lipid metabolism
MNTGKLIGMVCGVVMLIAGAYMVLAPYAKKAEEASYTQSVPADAQRGITEGAFAPQFRNEVLKDVQTIVEAKTTDAVVPPINATGVTPKPVAVTPTPIPAPTVSGYTVANVAEHSGEASCWSIINGNVYDLTSFVTAHPGGDRNILKICGRDGTSAFMGQHAGDIKPETTLSKFYLGKLSR